MEITREHLGASATDADVAEFVAAVRRIAPAFGDDEDVAADWLWGNGDYVQRLESCPGPECESCAAAGAHGWPATTHSQHPDYAGYHLCAACAAEYDSRRGPEE